MLLGLSSDVAHATALSAFHTPGWSAQCFVVGEEAPPALVCATPRNGAFVSMQSTVAAKLGNDPGEKGRHDVYAARRLLAFERYWAFGRLFGCASHASGLKCWNAAGHGWWIDRSGIRVF